jgi:hypothetical protein
VAVHLANLGEMAGGAEPQVLRPGGVYRGTSLKRNALPPQDHHRALGIVLLQGPMETWSLMSEVPLQLAHQVKCKGMGQTWLGVVWVRRA